MYNLLFPSAPARPQVANPLGAGPGTWWGRASHWSREQQLRERHFVDIMTFISRAPTLGLKGMKINSLAGSGRYGKCISFSLPQSLKVGDTHNVTATGLCINFNQLGKKKRKGEIGSSGRLAVGVGIPCGP